MNFKKSMAGLLAGAVLFGGGALAISKINTSAVAAAPATPEAVAQAEGYNFSVDHNIVQQAGPNGKVSMVIADVPTYGSIDALTKDAQVVVVGRVLGKGGTRNLARDPQDHSKEATDRKVMSQEYTFAVETYLKGSGESKIDIVYPETTTLSTGLAITEPESSLEAGQRYVLFLNKGEGYYGVGQPWQFQLANGKANAKAYNAEHVKSFQGLAEADLIQQIQNAAK